MPRQELEYPREPFSTGNRYSSRGSHALETIHRIVNTSPLIHVAFNDPNSPFPAVLPMIGQMGSFDRPSADLGDVLELYLHGYVSSRIINLTRNPPTPEGLPLTISASHVDGLVLALTPNSHSLNYRSAILFGHATLVTSVPEKLYAMELITNSIVPSRWEHTRVPPNAAEMQSTSVLRVKIATGSAKIRSGMPHDERGDMEDEELMKRVWTGVVPIHTVMGGPVAGPYNGVGDVPEYLERWRIEENKEAEVFAREQLKE
ncbi:hypothetical protein B0T14DRAFT_538945 [Immersiella caudata]|uniref:Flavin-nucleotide-binding protein n=1 Tax=Immersiella caudata TaxID=314043 RepID=A0AA39WLB8_9PEZI|nr:hypothetical protein B0T14DRAFT_538945 [Immersiella caudata]